MKTIKVLMLLIFVILSTGCATIVSQEEYEACIWGTSIAGAAIGSVGGIGGAAGGTAGGALVGAFICGKVGEEAPPPAPAAEEAGYFWPDDQDGDGVRDSVDRCPFTPAGVAVDSNGCELDTDGDGVPDYRDQCPDTPKGAIVDTEGCSRVLARLQDVHFAFDSAELTNEAKSVLDAAVATINSNPSDTISVEGHTDSTGSDAYNSQLSQRRARSVADYLASRGVSASRLQAVGKGESYPVASNDTSEGRSQNRRVEIIAK
ncbi:MAG: OmpA family protein [Gammaproteobacteria bacterium]